MASRKQCSSQPPKKKHCKIMIFFHQAPSSDESTPAEIDTEIDSETEDDAVDVAVVEEPTAGPSTESDHDAGMQIHIRPVARGDKNYVRAIVNQHVTSPAGDSFPVRSADHVWLFTRNCRAPHSMYRRRRLTRGCVYQPLG